jgi:NAD(P)-dependent dehydrogenase (short-subunit alcohol dehydrogenase family)
MNSKAPLQPTANQTVPVASLLDLRGRVAIVTGSSGNIGAGIARRLHEAGASVAVHANSNHGAADAVVASLGSRAISIVGDVERDAASLVAATVEAFGALHIVVNNAGIQPVAALAGIDSAAMNEMLRINVGGVAAMTREAAAVMVGAMAASIASDPPGEAGSIVNVSSIEGLQPAAMHSHYCASKAAVIMHTRAAALELGRSGIRVNCVSPGLIDVDGLEEGWPEGVARWKAAAPLQRRGTPTDIADAVLFLVSPAARWVTGANLVVDGGVLAHNTW